MSEEINQASFFKLIKNILKDRDRSEIFLKNSSSFAYPIKELESLDEQELTKIIVNFMGLLGSGSHLTSYILEKISKTNDNSYELFFDFFDNYLLWLFFDSISLKNYARSFEDELDDKISKILLDMLNIKEKQLAKKFLPFSPLAVSQRRPKKEVEFALQSHFGLKDKLFILENLPNQIFIAPSNLNSLGHKNRTLGKNFILGKKLFALNQFVYIRKAVLKVLFCTLRKFHFKLLEHFLSGKSFFQIADGSISHRIRNMDASAVYIQNNVSSVHQILVNHLPFLL